LKDATKGLIEETSSGEDEKTERGKDGERERRREGERNDLRYFQNCFRQWDIVKEKIATFAVYWFYTF
jgi:hypothetical protein